MNSRKSTKPTKTHSRKRRIIYIILSILVLLGAGLAFYAHRNMTYDHGAEKKLQRAGFEEKQAKLSDGSILNYGEGPANGPVLVLLHGQQVSWEDYVPVLPELAKRYHVYAIDYYGHGGSSKNPEKYSAKAISADIIWFIRQHVKQPVVISGHSSGGLLASLVAADAPDLVRGLVIEDAPFFTTEKSRAESTFAWKGFKDMNDFLASGEANFTRYWLDQTYMQELFNDKSPDSWNKIIKQPALDYMKRHPGKIPRIWLYPPELKVNQMFDLTANLQDQTGEYDLRFGQTFYNFSWFDEFDQAATLRRITSPSILLHVAPADDGYYDKRGVLVSAMDDKDARRVHELLGANNKLIDHIKSSHNIHQDRPKVFIQAIDEVAGRG